MPRIYISPSKQEGNPYIIGGTEEYYMNLIADAVEPYLASSGIACTRNSPNMTLRQKIDQANAGEYDLYLAIHSNAASAQLASRLQGASIYYYAGSVKAARTAQIITENYKKIYPRPEKVRALPTAEIQEIRLAHPPAVLIETAYHDNLEDAVWIRDHIQAIARVLAQSLAQYFGIPFVEPVRVRTGTVVSQAQDSNIRQKPDMAAPVLTKAPRGARVTVYGKTGQWYVVKYNEIIGYVPAQYVRA